MIRRAAVAGSFYPGTQEEIDRELAELWPPPGPSSEKALAIVCPHAGWIYSGRVAAKTIARVEVPERVVIMGPNHRGLGDPMAIMSEGSWLLPETRIDLDANFSRSLMNRCNLLTEDHQAHALEHSLEVQVPFLIRKNPKVGLVPICLGRVGLEDCRALGEALAETIDDFQGRVLILASTDMSHYESVESARLKDQQALDRILDLDPEGLYNTVLGQGITMCGVLPTTVALFAALKLGGHQAELVQYATSGEVNRNFNEVVGYAGLIIN